LINHFLACAIPGQDPAAVAAPMNWAIQNNFEISAVVCGIMPVQQGRIQTAAKQQGAAAPMFFVYCAASEEAFKNYFGEPYKEENLHKYPGIIAQIENAKIEKTSGPGSQ